MSANDRFFVFGEDPVFMLNTATDAAPAFNAIEYAEDILAGNSKNEGTFKPRVSPHELVRGGKFKTEFTFKYSLTLGIDPVCDALYDSFVNCTAIQFLWADRDITLPEVKGVKAWCEVLSFPMPSKAEEGVMVDITAKPTDYAEGGVLILPDYL